jgi:hypothetical protein
MPEADSNNNISEKSGIVVLSNSLPKSSQLAEPASPKTTYPRQTKAQQLSGLKIKIVEEVQSRLLDPDWEKVSDTCQLPVDKVRLYYNQAVTPVDHALLCLQRVNGAQIAQVLDTAVTACAQCRQRTFKLKKWDRLDYCAACYHRDFQPLLEARWRQVNVYLSNQHKDQCVLCKQTALYQKNSGYYFHLDHINMFEKAASVYEWVTDGTALEQVYQEVDKCQVLCPSCHAAVTLVERRSGFIRLKQNLTRNYNQTGELALSQDMSCLLYQQFMHTTYEHIRTYLAVLVPPSTSDDTSLKPNSSIEATIALNSDFPTQQETREGNYLPSDVEKPRLMSLDQRLVDPNKQNGLIAELYTKIQILEKNSKRLEFAEKMKEDLLARVAKIEESLKPKKTTDESIAGVFPNDTKRKDDEDQKQQQRDFHKKVVAHLDQKGISSRSWETMKKLNTGLTRVVFEWIQQENRPTKKQKV